MGKNRNSGCCSQAVKFFCILKGRIIYSYHNICSVQRYILKPRMYPEGILWLWARSFPVRWYCWLTRKVSGRGPFVLGYLAVEHLTWQQISYIQSGRATEGHAFVLQEFFYKKWPSCFFLKCMCGENTSFLALLTAAPKWLSEISPQHLPFSHVHVQ